MSGSLIRAHQEFVKDWADKFNALHNMASVTREGVASIAAGLAQNFASLKANLEMNSDALEQLDIFNQIWSKIFLFLIERSEQDKYLRINNIPEPALRGDDLLAIKAKSQTTFQDLFQLAKDQVIEERNEYIKELRTKTVAEQVAKTEEMVAEEALRNAEQSISMLGGEGSIIPEGADIFGG